LNRITIIIFVFASAIISSCASKQTESSSKASYVRPDTPISAEATRAAVSEIQINEADSDFMMAISEAIAKEGKAQVSKEEFWASVLEYDAQTGQAKMVHYQGDEQVYPASVIKLAYMLAAYHQENIGELIITQEIYDDIEQMIQVSSNVTTANMVEVLSKADDGESFENEADMQAWVAKRMKVTNYLKTIGLGGLFAFNKTYGTGVPLYGREVDALGERKGDNYEFSNMMTTNDTAKLLYLIATRQVVSPQACNEMMELMRRTDEHTYISDVNAPGVANVYSKGGSTGLTRHDAAIFEYPDGDLKIIVAFTKTRNVEGERGEVIEVFAEKMLAK